MALTDLFKEIKSDLTKSTILGVISIVTTAFLALATDLIPSEFKEPQMIALVGITVMLVVLINFFGVRAKAFWWIGSLTISIGLIFLSYSYFIAFTYKGLDFNHSEPAMALFYPTGVTDPVLQQALDNAVREMPSVISGEGRSFKINKIEIPENFDFDRSLLKRKLDRATSIISYMILVPDGKNMFLKLTFPPGLPYLDLGINTVENKSTEDKISLAMRINHVVFNGELKAIPSKIHYGFSHFSIGAGIEFKKSLLNKEALENTVLLPLRGGIISESKQLSGSIYFSFVMSLVDLYHLIGEEKSSCSLLLNYFDYDNDQNLQANIGYISSDVITQCSSAYWIDQDVKALKLLTDEQKGDLQKSLLSRAVSGEGSPKQLTELFPAEKQLFENAYQVNEICGSKNNKASYSDDYVHCLVDLIQKNEAYFNETPLLKDVLVTKIGDQFFLWLMTEGMKADAEGLVNYARFSSYTLGSIGEKEKACDDGMYMLLMVYAMKSLQQGDVEAFISGFNQLMLKTFQATDCENIAGISGNDMDEVWRPLANKLSEIIRQSIEKDVTVEELITALSKAVRDKVKMLTGPQRALLENIEKKGLDQLVRDVMVLAGEEIELSGGKAIDIGLSDDALVSAIMNLHAPISVWLDEFEKSFHNFSKLVDGKEKQEAIAGMFNYYQNYFVDPFARQTFFVISQKYQKEWPDRSEIFLKNAALDKLSIYRKLSDINSTDGKIEDDLMRILHDEYSDSEKERNRILHFEFLLNYKRGGHEAALAKLDQLISVTDTARKEFYQFTKHEIQSPGSSLGCAGHPDVATAALRHLLSTEFDEGEWPTSGELPFRDKLDAYFSRIKATGNEEDVQLVNRLEACRQAEAM